MITKEYLQQELAKRIDGYKRGVETTTDNIIAEMESILVLVGALQDRVKDYDDALKRAKDFKNGTVQFALEPGESIVHYIFPELRESEDEEIRQQLLWLCGQWEHNPEGRTIPADIDNIRKIRNWLEKQKEQRHYWKPTETDTALFNKAVTTNKALTPTERAQLDIIRSKFGYCRAVNCSRIMQEEQEPAEWSEKDEKIRKQLINICDEWIIGGYSARPCLNDVRWLKNLLEKQKEPTLAEWSEEDKDMLNCCISSIEEAKENRYAYKETDGDTSYDREIAFLKSLRPSWKPSEEQMEGLKFFLEFHRSQRNAGTVNWREYDAIESLYEQLKKL